MCKNIVNFGYRFRPVFELYFKYGKMSYSAYRYTFHAFYAIAPDDEVNEETRYVCFQEASNNGIVFW